MVQVKFWDTITQLHPSSATCHWGTRCRDLSLQQYILESRELQEKIRKFTTTTHKITYEQTLWSFHAALLDPLVQVGRSHSGAFEQDTTEWSTMLDVAV
jgi:hypothetical protein